jgi:hypothetical protein
MDTRETTTHYTLRGCTDKNIQERIMNHHTDSQNRQRTAIMPACYCTYFGCNGQLVDDKTRKRHQRMDSSETYHNHSEVCLEIGRGNPRVKKLYPYPYPPKPLPPIKGRGFGGVGVGVQGGMGGMEYPQGYHSRVAINNHIYLCPNTLTPTPTPSPSPQVPNSVNTLILLGLTLLSP